MMDLTSHLLKSKWGKYSIICIRFFRIFQCISIIYESHDFLLIILIRDPLHRQKTIMTLENHHFFNFIHVFFCHCHSFVFGGCLMRSRVYPSRLIHPPTCLCITHRKPYKQRCPDRLCSSPACPVVRRYGSSFRLLVFLLPNGISKYSKLLVWRSQTPANWCSFRG